MADVFFFYALGRFWCAMDHLHVKRDKSVARIAHHQNDSGPSKFSCGHEILSPNPVPQSAFHPLLCEVVRKNQPRDARLMVAVRPESERSSGAFAEIGAKKSPHPCASALRYRNDDDVATGKFARAAAEIPAAQSAAAG